jgi:hypothetical protein
MGYLKDGYVTYCYSVTVIVMLLIVLVWWFTSFVLDVDISVAFVQWPYSGGGG